MMSINPLKHQADRHSKPGLTVIMITITYFCSWYSFILHFSEIICKSRPGFYEEEVFQNQLITQVNGNAVSDHGCFRVFLQIFCFEFLISVIRGQVDAPGGRILIWQVIPEFRGYSESGGKVSLIVWRKIPWIKEAQLGTDIFTEYSFVFQYPSANKPAEHVCLQGILYGRQRYNNGITFICDYWITLLRINHTQTGKYYY